MAMIEKIMKYKAVSVAGLAAVALALGGFFWAYFGLRHAGGPIVLHFNDMDGVTETGTLWIIVLMGFSGVIITVVNFFIAIELEQRDRFLGKVVAVASVLFAVLLFLALTAILSVN